MNKIILYTRDGCPFCVKLKKLLVERSLPFEERELSQYYEEFKILKEEHGAKTVPTAVVNGRVIIGSDKIEEIAKEYGK